MGNVLSGLVVFFSVAIGCVISCRPWALRAVTSPSGRRSAACTAGPPLPGVCPICGMHDPDNLESHWRAWPAHADCLEWLMPGGPSFVDEYANPRMVGGPERANTLGGITTAEAGAAIAAMFDGARHYPTTGGYPSGDTPAHRLPPIPEWMMERQAVEATTLSDPEPVHLPGAILRKPQPPPGPGSATTAR